MSDILITTRMAGLTKALQQGNSQAPTWFYNLPAATSLLPQQLEPTADGTYPPLFLPGERQQNRLFLLPYAETGPGQAFSMRLWGWRRLPGTTDDNPNTTLWIPFLLCELACVTGLATGLPAAGPSVSQFGLKDTESLCDTITLAQGSLGLTGLVNSTGGQASAAGNPQAPGLLTSYVLVELAGCQKWSFDFQAEQSNPTGMNCLWAIA